DLMNARIIKRSCHINFFRINLLHAARRCLALGKSLNSDDTEEYSEHGDSEYQPDFLELVKMHCVPPLSLKCHIHGVDRRPHHGYENPYYQHTDQRATQIRFVRVLIFFHLQSSSRSVSIVLS